MIRTQPLRFLVVPASLISLLHFTPSAQAAVLGGSATCQDVSFAYLDCAGAFEGNDKGSDGTALDNLNSLFGSGWIFAGDSDDDKLVSFLSGGEDTVDGTASAPFSGFGAISIKAGDSYSLYTIADLATFDWSTTGVTPVGRGRTPGLSHLSVYIREGKSQSVPESGAILGLAVTAGLGLTIKNRKS